MSDKVIYKIINLKNGKFYVGSTTNTRERFRTHRKRLRRNKHHSHHLQAAWNKYGEENFVFQIIETIPDGESLQEAENKWLIEHVGQPYCYNLSKDAFSPMRGRSGEKHPNFGKPVNEEQRQAISERLKAFYAEDIRNHPRFGKFHSEETKALIRAKKLANPAKHWLGKSRSEETKEKIGDAQRGKPKAQGRKVSEAGLAKIRASAAAGNYSHWKGKKHTEESKQKMRKPIEATDPNGQVHVYDSLTATFNSLGILMPTLARALKSGKALSKGSRMGWSFKYIDTPFKPC